MSPTTLNPPRTLADQGRSSQHTLRLARSTLGAWCLLGGLPALGLLAALFAALPLFAGLMAGCFLLATALTCQKAVATFTRQALRLLVTARVVLVVVPGGLLCGTVGAEMTRYHHLAEQSGWRDSESRRLGYGGLARLLETEARPRRNPVTTAATLTGRFCGGFKTVRPGDLSARVQDWHANA